jgi:hypothetical protein
MIATNIGRTFLNAYNEKNKSNYTAKEFFIEKYFPLFFDHEKYMQWITNSPFVQGIKKGVTPTTAERKIKLKAFIDKISNNEADASIAIGFASLDLNATTSGQITNMQLPFKKEDIYLSWIGSGLGIGVQGGLSILFFNEQILLDIYDGWRIYREFLNTTPNLRGNQINTWNGQWIAHRYNKLTYDASNQTASFFPFDSMKNGEMEITTQSWIKVIVEIARNYPNEVIIGYIYSLGQTNITVGFVPFELPKIKKPYELYEKYFGAFKKEQIDYLFGTALGFEKACQMGVIGTNALEPKGFRDFMYKGIIPKYNNDEEKTINFNTYKIWLLTMLNNEQLWEKSQEFAQQLVDYIAGSEKARVNRKTNVKNLLQSTKKDKFLNNLIPIIKDTGGEKYTVISKEVNSISESDFRYFMALLKLQVQIN